MWGEVLHEERKSHLLLLAVKGEVLAWLSRNWLQKVMLDWNTSKEEVLLKMKVILVQFDSVFSNELGHLKDIKVKLPIDKTAIL